MKSMTMVSPTDALPGRNDVMPVAECHTVLGHPLTPPFPPSMEILYIALGCFWGAERAFWKLPGVYTTAVGYMAGYTPNPTYREVCSGMTGHTEAVMVVFDPKLISCQQLLEHFWQSHDPTQGMRQGNDCGSQYRSGIYTTTAEQMQLAQASKAHYQSQLIEAGKGVITTELKPAPPFYYAEDYHQQYLDKNPSGYCGLGGTGVCY